MASQGTPVSTSHSRQYQGYPYVTPIVTDVPSLSSEAVAARWKELPKRTTNQTPNAKKNDNAPVIYVDLPEDGGADATELNEIPSRSDDQPTPSQTKKEEDENPVVYIDIPGQNRDNQDNNDSDDEDHVQETIFYDPFENRRIDVAKENNTREQSNLDSISSPQNSSRPFRPAPATEPSRPRPPRPVPPSSLNIASPGSSSGYGTNSTPGTTSALNVPHWMSKETSVYSPHNDDGFNLTPLPVTEFPEPPPAYTEIDTRVSSPQPSVVVEQPRPQITIPPRTQVITQDISLQGLPNSPRKFLVCQHCGFRVHTLVLRQSGAATHVLALSFLSLCLIPITALVYCTDCCKYKNHYCPSCNKMIGYEVPMLCQKFVYAD